jgi:acetyltransferase-like isoleucine patch superfamily enzyme
VMTNVDPSRNHRKRARPYVTVRHGAWLVVEKLLSWCVHPRLRARLLSLLGARIGRNVRVYEIRLFNLDNGFASLSIGDDVHIGPGCALDLAGTIQIGPRSTLSPRGNSLTHADPGASHGSGLCALYSPRIGGVTIGADCWVGANATILVGANIGNRVVIGAGSVVIGDIESDRMAAGVPARVRKTLVFD